MPQLRDSKKNQTPGGGACGSAPYECRAARRDAYYPVGSTCVWGFRLAVNPPPARVLAQGPFSYTVSDGAVAIVKYTGSGGDLIIPYKINKLPVTGIGAGAFTGCTKLTGVTIPSTVTGIAKEAFSGCTSLVSVHCKGNAPAGAADPSVFSGADQVNVYYLPETTGWAATFGGRPTFLKVQDYNCSINDGAVTIRQYTGSGGAVVIPAKINGLPVTAIGAWSCQSRSLTRVTIPDSVTSIEACAFEGSGLTNVTIPASVTSIGNENPFGANADLVSISVDPANPAYTSGADGVVFSKDKTKLIAYPVGKAGSYAIPEEVTCVMSRAFLGAAGLTEIAIPNGITEIGDFAFDGCSGLTRIEIPNSVTRIGNWGFHACAGLTCITIPATVTGIGGGAFNGCTNLTSICFMGNVPNLGDNVFGGADKATICYLPNTTGWGKEFGGRPTAVWDAKKAK